MTIKEPTRFCAHKESVALGSDWRASVVPTRPDPPVSVDGMTIGVARMSENSPHGGEMHPDGDEFLFLSRGRVRVVFEAPAFDDIELSAGDGLLIPKGVWHRVDILEPSEIVYATPGPGGEYRPIGFDADAAG